MNIAPQMIRLVIFTSLFKIRTTQSFSSCHRTRSWVSGHRNCRQSALVDRRCRSSGRTGSWWACGTKSSSRHWRRPRRVCWAGRFRTALADFRVEPLARLWASWALWRYVRRGCVRDWQPPRILSSLPGSRTDRQSPQRRRDFLRRVESNAAVSCVGGRTRSLHLSLVWKNGCVVDHRLLIY